METNPPKLGQTALILNYVTQNNENEHVFLNDPSNSSYSYKSMNSALFKILCDLKETKSVEPSAPNHKLNRSLMAKDAQHQRLNRMLKKETIFKKDFLGKTSDRPARTVLTPYRLFMTPLLNPYKYGFSPMVRWRKWDLPYGSRMEYYRPQRTNRL